jgi:hypothetical protein
MQSRNRPEVYAGHGTHGSPADGFGTCGQELGTTQNPSPGKRNQKDHQKGGKSMTGRYIYCPMTAKRIGRRVTLIDRIRRAIRRKDRPDVYEIIGYCSPIYPGK